MTQPNGQILNERQLIARANNALEGIEREIILLSAMLERVRIKQIPRSEEYSKNRRRFSACEARRDTLVRLKNALFIFHGPLLHEERLRAQISREWIEDALYLTPLMRSQTNLRVEDFPHGWFVIDLTNYQARPETYTVYAIPRNHRYPTWDVANPLSEENLRLKRNVDRKRSASYEGATMHSHEEEEV